MELSDTSVTQWTCHSPPLATVDILQSEAGLLSQILSTECAGADRSKRTKKLFLVLPGNPCIVECYAQFASLLKSQCHSDVLVVGYAGHSLTSMSGRRLFSLLDQVDLCHSFFDVVLRSPQVLAAYGDDIFVVGHSIGAFIGMQMLARFYSRINTFFGIAPVLTRMHSSPNGRMLTPMTIPVIQDIVPFLVSMLAFLPIGFRKAFGKVYGGNVEPKLFSEIVRRVHRSQIQNVLFLTQDELRMVAEPDWELMGGLQKKMALYYVPIDKWAPPTHAQEIRSQCPDLKGYIMEDEAFGVTHAWCVNHSQTVIQHAVLPFL